MKRTILILLDSLIFAGVLPGCGTAMSTIADMSGPAFVMAGGFITIVPSIGERDLIVPGAQEVDTGPAAPASDAEPPPAPPDKESPPPPPSPQPQWDVPILSTPKIPKGPVEKSVASPFSEADSAVEELIAKLDIPEPRKVTVHHQPGDTAGLVAIYAMNLREVLVVDPLDAEGRVSPESLVLFEDLLRSRKTGATHEVDPALVRLLYAVALAHDRVLMVSSGYREPGSGTSATSYHTKGMAADVRHPYLPAKSIVDFARQWGAGGVGYYPKTRFVHLDVRKDPYYWVDYSGDEDKGQVIVDWEGKLADEAAAIWEPDDWPAEDFGED